MKMENQTAKNALRTKIKSIKLFANVWLASILFFSISCVMPEDNIVPSQSTMTGAKTFASGPSFLLHEIYLKDPVHYIKMTALSSGDMRGYCLKIFDYRYKSGKDLYCFQNLQVRTGQIFSIFLIKNKNIAQYVNEDVTGQIDSSKAYLADQPIDLANDREWDIYSKTIDKMVTSEFMIFIQNKYNENIDAVVTSNRDGDIQKDFFAQINQIFFESSIWHLSQRPVKNINEHVIQNESVDISNIQNYHSLWRANLTDTNSYQDWVVAPSSIFKNSEE